MSEMEHGPKTVVSAEGLRQMEEKLKYMKTVRRAEVAEHLNIARPGHAFQGLLRVAADVSERLGSDSFCHVRADSGEMLTLRVRGDFAPDYGAPLELGFDPEHCHLFDSNGQALDKRLQQAA